MFAKRIFPFFTAFLAIGCHGGSDQKAGEPLAGRGEKILNGVAADPATFPQMVKLTVTRVTDEGLVQALCSGTVIGTYAVLTAAHCVESGTIGVTVSSPLAGDIPAVAYAVHPQRGLDPAGVDGNYKDVAVVLTGDPAAGTGVPLPLPKLGVDSSLPSAAGEPILIFGYGINDEGDIGELYAGQMQISATTPDRILAVYEDSANTCFGDSGGAAVRTRFGADGTPLFTAVVGIAEAGSSPDCSPGETSSFTAMSEPSVTAFIRQFVPDAAIY